MSQSKDSDRDFMISIQNQMSELEREHAALMRTEESRAYKIPDYNPNVEKWVDLDGTQTMYLRMVYGNGTSNDDQQPITEINFFNITSGSDSQFVSYSA